MMTATELFKSSSDALAITGPAEWISPDDPGQRDALIYVDQAGPACWDEAAEDGPLWCLAPAGSDQQAGPANDDDYIPMDTVMARELIESHLHAWLLSRGWQVQVTVHQAGSTSGPASGKRVQRWRLVDCLSIADGGGDRLDDDYPFGNDELSVLCASVSVVAASARSRTR